MYLSAHALKKSVTLFKISPILREPFEIPFPKYYPSKSLRLKMDNQEYKKTKIAKLS